MDIAITALMHNVCNQSKKGSYMLTTSAHNNRLTNKPCVHLLWPTVHQSAAF